MLAAKEVVQETHGKMKMLLDRRTEWLVFSLVGGVLALLPIAVQNQT